MPTNIDDIKKLSSEEKLRIIRELWDSIDEDVVERELISEEEFILREREEEYKKGTMNTDVWENVKERLKKKAEERLKGNK